MLPPEIFTPARECLLAPTHVTCREADMTICVQLLGASPLKFGRAKNVQNFARFRTILDFDREYLLNGWIYRKSEKGVLTLHPKLFFSENYILTPRRCCPLTR